MEFQFRLQYGNLNNSFRFGIFKSLQPHLAHNDKCVMSLPTYCLADTNRAKDATEIKRN